MEKHGYWDKYCLNLFNYRCFILPKAVSRLRAFDGRIPNAWFEGYMQEGKYKAGGMVTTFAISSHLPWHCGYKK
ncbi:hypothetical protein O9929_00780 [Vibrio lentus]|nr:hypothetical protein [Vibrio lentus]